MKKMKMNVYDVYMDDGRDCFKVTVPAVSEKNARDYVEGNGEVISIRLNPILQDINIECLAETLEANRWGRLEIDVITRALIMCGLDR